MSAVRCICSLATIRFRTIAAVVTAAIFLQLARVCIGVVSTEVVRLAGLGLASTACCTDFAVRTITSKLGS